MRVLKTNCGLTVNAIAGTYVVMFGFNLPEEDCPGLLGFSLHRRDHTENEAYYLKGTKTFQETDPGFPSGSSYSTRDHPIQSFQWADYTAKPGHDYTYTITALKGTPASLVSFTEVSIYISTESPESGDHDIYFNRGVAASQAYATRFGNRPPDQVENNKAFEWLSRGLYEAMAGFVDACQPGRHALRIAAYELHYPEFLAVLKSALERGVDIQIIYDARQEKPGDRNRLAAAQAGLAGVCIERTHPKSYISHNKFMLKLEDGQPVEVWTGGTNFSSGGIFGHSNVAHVVQDPAVASLYHHYWQALAQDPTNAALKPQVEVISPLPQGLPPIGTSVLFSPRKSLQALDWYADLALNAREGLMMTFAFGMHDLFKNAYQNGQALLRMALLEKKTRPMKAGPERAAEEKKIDDLRKLPQNVFAIGDFIRINEIDGWLQERLSNLNSNVRYVHNKFMLVDPLGEDPIVVTGSANFSDASVRDNDENMLVVRGNKRAADIYLGEFMRLFSHHAFRESLNFSPIIPAPKHLRTDDWWQDYFGDTKRSTRRKFFARVQE